MTQKTDHRKTKPEKTVQRSTVALVFSAESCYCIFHNLESQVDTEKPNAKFKTCHQNFLNNNPIFVRVPNTAKSLRFQISVVQALVTWT